ncbi:MAG: hypothetical protein L3K09_06085, partial [Thermoplasmata archaeon]|nr:hypothetical protein [Thermoplasmata archaeon]
MSAELPEPRVPSAFGPLWLPRFFRRNLPAIALVTLSITFAELLTGSTPVLALVTSLSLPFLLGLYGGGVLLVREAMVRWRVGWSSVLLLGAAYGIAEEGFGTKTFFDPQASAVGFLGTYGHALGVNWVWAAELTIFHAVFSIALPILVVGLAFPSMRGRSFLTARSIRLVAAAFGATVVVMFFLFDRTYAPGLLVLLEWALAAISLVVLARFLPTGWTDRLGKGGTHSTQYVAIAGALFVWLFFIDNL